MTTKLAKFAMNIIPYHLSLDDRWATYTSQYLRGDKDAALESAKLRDEYEKVNDFLEPPFQILTSFISR